MFGGAAGPGKTKALLYEAILQAHKHPGVDTLLLRRTFPELEASLITYFRRDVKRELYDKYTTKATDGIRGDSLASINHQLQNLAQMFKRLAVGVRARDGKC